MRILVGLMLAALVALGQPNLEKEAKLGASLAAEVRKQTTDLANPEVLAYVNRIGAKLAGQLADKTIPYKFAVTANNRSNSTYEPLSLPGGYIFVPAGLILAADDEAEFAGMLAHSMAHVNRWQTEGAQEQADPADAPLIVMGRRSGDVLTHTEWASESQSKLLPLYEADADVAAIGVLARAGFDPAALLRYIDRMQLEESAEGAADRVARMKKAIEELPARTYAAGGDGFGEIQLNTREAMAAVPVATPNSGAQDNKDREDDRPTLIRGGK